MPRHRARPGLLKSGFEGTCNPHSTKRIVSAGRLSAKDVFDAAAAGDGLANRIVDETAGWLALACLNLTRLLDPQMIVFAGGMILAGDLLFNRVRRAIGDLNWNVGEIKARIVPAVLGNDAGFIGAAAVAWDAHQSGRLGVS